MKEVLYSVLGVLGGFLSFFFGCVDQLLVILCVLMCVDYVSGIIIAVVFKKSPKTETGLANSAVGFKGICKKVYMLMLVGVANMLDVALNCDFCRSGLLVAFVANETLSIIENAGIMGVPIPKVIKEAIDLLNKGGKKIES